MSSFFKIQKYNFIEEPIFETKGLNRRLLYLSSIYHEKCRVSNPSCSWNYLPSSTMDWFRCNNSIQDLELHITNGYSTQHALQLLCQTEKNRSHTHHTEVLHEFPTGIPVQSTPLLLTASSCPPDTTTTPIHPLTHNSPTV